MRREGRPIRVLEIASEVAPFAKTGGLADVLEGLPAALARTGVDVRVVLPRYRCVETERFGFRRRDETIEVRLGKRTISALLWEGLNPTGNVTTWLLDAPSLFDRDGLYVNPGGAEFPDNATRFAFLAQGALAAARVSGFTPDVVHVHDWHAALVPAYLHDWSAAGGQPATLLTIHNLAFGGWFPASCAPELRLAREMLAPPKDENPNAISFMRTGLERADLLNTVSERYAREILTPEFGCGLHPVLRGRETDLAGVVNGIDVSVWDPAHDPELLAPYSAKDLTGKTRSNEALTAELGFTEASGPLCGMVTRLTEQKGIDLVVDAAETLREIDARLVVLGTGETRYERALERLARSSPGRIAAEIRFDEGLAHRIYAGSDAFLMPSRFEPCGLGQMIALRYGTVPVVAETGGLADTIRDIREGGWGIVFGRGDLTDFRNALHRLRALYDDRAEWKAVVERGMVQDVSWNEAATCYLKLFERALARRRTDP